MTRPRPATSSHSRPWPRPTGLRLRLACAARLLLLAAPIVACTPGEGEDATSATDGSDADDAEIESTGAPGEPLLCEPGTAVCTADGLGREVCDDGGQSLEIEACEGDERCVDGLCRGPCELVEVEGDPSAAGCSFTTQASAQNADEPDGLMVTNISDAPATVQLLETPRGTHDEIAVGAPVVLGPGAGHLFTIPGEAIGEFSAVFAGGSHRVVSDMPVIVHQQAPLQLPSSDSGLLLPDHALGLEYIVPSYPALHEPSYFTIVAVDDYTHVQWTPPTTTAGSGLPIPMVGPGETGELTLHRGDTLRIGASAKAQPEPLLRDLSGTLIAADKPIAVVGGSRCAQVPADVPECDHLYEPLLPVATWGRSYVGGPAPAWQDGAGVWRIYAGADGVTVDVAVTGADKAPAPITLGERGEWVELELEGAAVFTGDGPFMPVYYLRSAGKAGGIGDPAMVQAPAVEQQRARYAFATPAEQDAHVAWVTRPLGGAAVMIDGAPVDGFEIAVGGHEIAVVPVAAGHHEATSAEPFGLVLLGHGEATASAHLGGIGLADLSEE
ncbi:MAG: IgGFc-binding protein [Myxococcales bacterium]|nr:IgGFc-binding protein [Myxococcales bacterium]